MTLFAAVRSVTAMCVVFLALSFSCPVYSQAPASVDPPATASNDPGKEAVLIEKMWTRYHVETDGSGLREVTVRARVQSDAGVKQLAILAFAYTASSQQIEIPYVRVIKPNGTVISTPDYNVQDLPAPVTQSAPMYSDVHQKHVAVKALGVGDTLEYQVILRIVKPEVPGQFWMSYEFQKDAIVLDERLELDLPATKTVLVSSPDLRPEESTAQGRRIYRWHSANRSHPDPDAPQKSYRHHKPTVQATSFHSWEEVGAWYRQLAQDRMKITPEIQSRADALVKGLNTREEKMQALFKEVATHIHYVGISLGIGHYQPHAADEVLSNEYGDCKDKHTLLNTLLQAEGIEAWPVLIGSGPDLDPDVPSPAQFDHVITVVPQGDKLLWMDSTEEVAPVGMLLANLRDKQALVIPPGKAAFLNRTPVDPPYPTKVEFTAEGKLSSDGVLTARIHQRLRGDAELFTRYAFRETSEANWKDLVQNISGSEGFGGEISNPTILPPEQWEQPFTFSYDYKREKYSDWENHQFTPPFPPIGIEIVPGSKQIKPADEIELGEPGETIYIANLEIPKGWILIPPEGKDRVKPWAEYHASYKLDGGVLHAEKRYVLKEHRIPLKEWDDYREFGEAVYNEESRYIRMWNESGGKLFDEDYQKEVVHLYGLIETLAQNKLSAEEVDKVYTESRNTVEQLEARTRTLHLDDPRTAYWTDLLSLSWGTFGWAALEKKDLATAHQYLEAAWKLGQDFISGQHLGQVLEEEKKKEAAAHIYLLASHATGAFYSIKGVSFLETSAELQKRYKRLAGENARPSIEPVEEMNRSRELRISPSSKLNGHGLFLVALEPGKTAEVHFLEGEPGFEKLLPRLKELHFPATFPANSKARILREVRVICSPYSGCDGYLLLPSNLEMPGSTIRIAPLPGVPGKSIEIPLEQKP